MIAMMLLRCSGVEAPDAAFDGDDQAGGLAHRTLLQGRSAAEDGGGRLFCFAMQRRLQAPAENSGPAALR
jgi:hypothetical protein